MSKTPSDISKTGGDAPVVSKLPKATVERWEQIVVKAARSGTDIAQLVQHFAEQSFQNKVTLLETQGTRRRALGQMLHTIDKERARVQAEVERGPQDPRGDKLRKPYQAVRIDFLPPEAATKEKKRENLKEPPMGLTGEKAGCKVVPLDPPLTSLAALQRYGETLQNQGESVQREIGQLDTVLNKGVRNHQAVVDELSQTSRELYRMAQEILARQPARPSPAPMPLNEDTKTYVDRGGGAEVATAALGPEATASVAAPAAAIKNKALWEQVFAAWGKFKGGAAGVSAAAAETGKPKPAAEAGAPGDDPTGSTRSG